MSARGHNMFIEGSKVEMLERIAIALETIATHLTKEDAREQASLRSQYEHLLTVADRADASFGAADNSMLRRSEWLNSEARERSQERLQWLEDEANEAHAAAQAFAAAHPEIAEVVDAERRTARQMAAATEETEW